MSSDKKHALKGKWLQGRLVVITTARYFHITFQAVGTYLFPDVQRKITVCYQNKFYKTKKISELMLLRLDSHRAILRMFFILSKISQLVKVNLKLCNCKWWECNHQWCEGHGLKKEDGISKFSHLFISCLSMSEGWGAGHSVHVAVRRKAAGVASLSTTGVPGINHRLSDLVAVTFTTEPSHHPVY